MELGKAIGLVVVGLSGVFVAWVLGFVTLWGYVDAYRALLASGDVLLLVAFPLVLAVLAVLLVLAVLGKAFGVRR